MKHSPRCTRSRHARPRKARPLRLVAPSRAHRHCQRPHQQLAGAPASRPRGRGRRPATGLLDRAPWPHYTPVGVAPLAPQPAGRPAVVVVGDVMVDVVVHPLGPFNRGSDTRSRVAVTPGGSAANQAVALAAAGVQTHLVGLVGDDEFGRSAARALATAGVRAHLQICPGQRTGVVVALVDASGERSMLTDRGANLCLDKATLEVGLAGAGLAGSGLAGSGPAGSGQRPPATSTCPATSSSTRPPGQRGWPLWSLPPVPV